MLQKIDVHHNLIRDLVKVQPNITSIGFAVGLPKLSIHSPKKYFAERLFLVVQLRIITVSVTVRELVKNIHSKADAFFLFWEKKEGGGGFALPLL